MNRTRRCQNIGNRQSNSNSIIEGHRGTSRYRVKSIYSAGSMVEDEDELTAPGPCRPKRLECGRIDDDHDEKGNFSYLSPLNPLNPLLPSHTSPKPCACDFDAGRDHGNKDDRHNHNRKILLDELDVAKIMPEKDDAVYPEKRADEIVGVEFFSIH